MQVTGTNGASLARLLSPLSLRSLLKALAPCLAFDAGSAALLLAASPAHAALQPQLPLTLPGSASLQPLAADSAGVSAVHDSGSPFTPEQPSSLTSPEPEQLCKADASPDAQQQQEHQLESALPSAPVADRTRVHVPLALQLLTRVDSFTAVANVVCMLGRLADLAGTLTVLCHPGSGCLLLEPA